jgi:endonuclease YncB( thermonuclease family)
LASLALAYRPRMLILSQYHRTSQIVVELFQKIRMVRCTKVNMNLASIALALALLVPVSARAATIIIDGDTIDVGGRRIGIVEIDAPETFGPRCENELILGLKAKSGFVNCPDSRTVPENILEDG